MMILFYADRLRNWSPFVSTAQQANRQPSDVDKFTSHECNGIWPCEKRNWLGGIYALDQACGPDKIRVSPAGSKCSKSVKINFPCLSCGGVYIADIGCNVESTL